MGLPRYAGVFGKGSIISWDYQTIFLLSRCKFGVIDHLLAWVVAILARAKIYDERLYRCTATVLAVDFRRLSHATSAPTARKAHDPRQKSSGRLTG